MLEDHRREHEAGVTVFGSEVSDFRLEEGEGGGEVRGGGVHISGFLGGGGGDEGEVQRGNGEDLVHEEAVSEGEFGDGDAEELDAGGEVDEADRTVGRPEMEEF